MSKPNEKLPAGKKPRKREQNRNAENHAALLAVAGEGATPSTPERVKGRISLFSELKELGVRHSRRQVDRLEIKDKFPKRVALGTGRVGWITDEIIAHVDKQIESRSDAKGTLGSGDSCRHPAREAAIEAARAKAKRTKAVPKKTAQQPQAP